MMRNIALLLALLSVLDLSKAGIREGFQKKQMQLEDILPIVGTVRRLETEPEHDSTDYEDISDHYNDYKYLPESSVSKKKKSSKKTSKKSKGKGKGEAKGDSASKGKKSSKGVSSKENTPGSFPEIPEGRFEGKELSFVILMDEMAYSDQDMSIGSKFAFYGRLATNDLKVGSASGSCTIGSAADSNVECCEYFLTFNTDGNLGTGTVALSGNTDGVGGQMQVTGTGDDLSGSNKGSASLVYDPAGNPIIYISISLQ